ncbi:probable glutamate receptor [Folsomia candida]|nr:probable glutamate receptor [Folsomia candida]
MEEDLSGVVIRVSAVDSNDEKFIAKLETVGNHSEFVGGFFVEILHYLRDALHFSIVAVPGQEFITDLNGTTVGGTGAKLLNDEVDLVIASSYMLRYRIKHLSPTLPVNIDKIMVWFRPPRKYVMEDGFITPFSTPAWFGLISLLAIIVTCAVLVSRIDARLRPEEKKCGNNFWIFGAFYQRGCKKTPARFPHRLVFIQALTSFWIVYTIYSASVLSRLTVSYNPFTTFAKILKANFKILANPLTSTFFEKNLEVTWRSTFVSKMDSVWKIMQGGYAFVTSQDAVGVAARRWNFTDWQICEFISAVPFDNLVIPLAFYTRKEYPYKEAINRKLIKSMENGLHNRLRKDFERNTYPVCVPIYKMKVESITFSEIYSAFFIILVADMLALVGLLGEKCSLDILASPETYLDFLELDYQRFGWEIGKLLSGAIDAAIAWTLIPRRSVFSTWERLNRQQHQGMEAFSVRCRASGHRGVYVNSLEKTFFPG